MVANVKIPVCHLPTLIYSTYHKLRCPILVQYNIKTLLLLFFKNVRGNTDIFHHDLASNIEEQKNVLDIWRDTEISKTNLYFNQ